MSAKFSPGFGLFLKSGYASNLKARKGSIKARPDIWPGHWPICWWFAGGQLSKAKGRGVCCTGTLS